MSPLMAAADPSAWGAVAAGIPSPSQGTWEFGPIPVRAYAIAILAGIALATWISVRRYRERGGPTGVIMDAIFLAVPLGIIGARIYHVFSSPDAYFGPEGNPWNAFAIWNGGLGIWGAIPAGALGVWIVLRRAGLRLSTVADAMAPAVLVAQAVGRLGNYFNQELFGAPTTLPWGLQIDPSVLMAQGMDYPQGTLFHPTFLYELLWNLALAGLLVWVDRRYRLGHGRVFWLYVFGYTAGRVWIEMLRIDEAETVLGLRLNVWTSILVGLVALLVFVVLSKRYPEREDSPWLPGREPVSGDADDPDAGASGGEVANETTAAEGNEDSDEAGSTGQQDAGSGGSTLAPVEQEKAEGDER
ncbi:prolipoprotein diacylglyceryl transferase [Ruania alkalisoli]|uniref:Phosphatidylglycerol--prolipoprotein diacylglyceryl transferase n=1 Tax=Ruania alkalisoli TaxID=2779775 RepID=A0A7M1SZ87_9MICO|nr:prolipoprotein diacylglyceryl transferase [Ruania alkalisoli]QOR72327.1 prolipoprotein diacylglyceryl transferase [Ruania alkalisoli]